MVSVCGVFIIFWWVWLEIGGKINLGGEKILLLFHFVKFSPPSDDDDDDDDVGEPCLYSCSCCGHLASPPLGLNEVLLLDIILFNYKMI